MKHNKIFALLAVAIVLAASCAAYADGVKIGMLMPAKLVAGASDKPHDVSYLTRWAVFGAGHGVDEASFRFYSNLTIMLMALNAGEIDEISLSQPVGEYVTSVNPEFKITCAARISEASFVFGFREGEGEAMMAKFNAALAAMRQDGTLDALRLKYCSNPGVDKLDSVEMETFPDAQTVRVAVTGDIPPLDFVAADGEAAGFNTAILAEIGRRAKLNIKLVYVETAARTTALMSGRADAVYWYQLYKGAKEQPDAADGVIFSAPYYDTNIFLHVGRK